MGKIVGTEVAQNTEGDNDVRLVTIEITDPDDLQTVENFLAGGIDYNPANDVVALVDDAGDSYKIVAGFDDGITPSVDRGEIEIYSTESDGSAKSARVKCVNDGTVELNGDVDNLVRFAKLQEAFDQLKSDYDDLVTQFNKHIHTTTATVGASTTPGTITPPANASGSPSTADIGPAKVEEVLTP
jgi:hypothetical protein